jgi:RNA polymerase sigma-70 factor (ECF subfamily)
LYLKFERQLRRFALSLKHNEAEADDLLQETFLRALSNAITLSSLPEYKQRAWLYKVLKNILIDRRRRGRYEVSLEGQNMPNLPFNNSTRMEIEELLDSLSHNHRDVIVKRYWLDMTSKQIAVSLSVPEATVRYRLHVAIQRLRSQLKNSGGM